MLFVFCMLFIGAMAIAAFGAAVYTSWIYQQRVLFGILMGLLGVIVVGLVVYALL